jgi:MoxR-like ATPase
VFDEYDAGRPDVMFVIQRVLEARAADPARPEPRDPPRIPAFRLFATANTIGLGDTSGLYHGTQQINQAQMDRWSGHRAELSAARAESAASFCPSAQVVQDGEGREQTVSNMVRLADLTRNAFIRRPVHRDEPAHGHHLGPERGPSSAISALPSASPSSTSAMRPSARWWPNSTSAALAKNCLMHRRTTSSAPCRSP